MSVTDVPGAAAPSRSDRHVGIMIVHGIGVNDLGYAEVFMQRVMDQLRVPERTRVHWQPVFWADVIRPHQMGYLQRARGIQTLHFAKMRRFVLSALADAASYNKIGDPNESVYLDIQLKLNRAVRHLKDDADPDRPVIIVAHSLGCHIVSSYIHDIWSLRKKTKSWINRLADGEPPDVIDNEVRSRHWSERDLERIRRSAEDLQRDRFEDLQSLCGLITLGCNIPVFNFRFHPFQIRPIEFPCARLPSSVETPSIFLGKTEWLNFFSPFDPLGYPLKPLSPVYEKRVSEDIPVWCGEGMSFLTPYSHSGYWTSRKVIGRAVRLVRNLMHA